MVVVHLHESDYVAADTCYKNSFEYVNRVDRSNELLSAVVAQESMNTHYSQVTRSS